MNAHFTRREFLATATLAGCGLAVPGCSTPRSAAQKAAPAALTHANGPGVVRVRQGLLKGVVQDGVLVFRGVPFAAPPVGALRFRPPQPAAQWEGLRDAVSNGPAAIQPIRHSRNPPMNTSGPSAAMIVCISTSGLRWERDRIRYLSGCMVVPMSSAQPPNPCLTGPTSHAEGWFASA